MMHRNVNSLVFVLRRNDEAQARFQGIGEATAQGGKTLGARHDEVGSCTGAGCSSANGCSLGTAPVGRRQGITEARRPGQATPTRYRTGKSAGQDTDGWCVGGRISDRTLDLATHRQHHHRAVWSGIQPRPFMALASSDGILLPKAGEARHPAQRAGDCSVEAARMACAQKKARREGRTIVFIDESGLSERPSVARTWSLRGQTPVLQHSFTWKQLSAIAGLTFQQFYFRFFPGAIRSEQVIEFLGALKQQISRPLLIIWDGAAIHRSRKVAKWLEGLNGHIAVARLPPYAPELNPVEAIWAYLKKHEIANLCLNTIGEVGEFARNRLKSMQRRPALVVAFWKQAELKF
jgi:transposase